MNEEKIKRYKEFEKEVLKPENREIMTCECGSNEFKFPIIEGPEIMLVQCAKCGKILEPENMEVQECGHCFDSDQFEFFKVPKYEIEIFVCSKCGETGFKIPKYVHDKIAKGELNYQQD